MKKSVVSIVVLSAVLLVCNVWMFAQSAQPPAAQTAPGANAQSKVASDQDIEMLRQNIRARRKEITAQNMSLTADEATKFWPIFDQYRKEAIKPNDERWSLMKEYAAHYDTLTDAEANDYMKRATAVDEQLLELRMKYIPIFEKVISGKKTARWYQIDRHIDLLINLQFSEMLPLVNASK